MTKVVFETATLADSIKKAERIAPDKGQAFDKASGIVIEVHPDDSAIVVRATNLDVYYMEWVDSLEISGPKIFWRLPSRVFSAFVASLPIGSGKTVSLDDKGTSQVSISSGRATAKLNTIDIEYYPEWAQFDESSMTTVPELGGRITQVEWAASKTDYALGLRFTGESVLANDRLRLASVPLKIDGLEEPITVPPGMFSGIIRERADTKVKVEGTQFCIMPDDHTQMRCVIIGDKYPPVERVMVRDHEEIVKFKKTELIDMLNRTMKISGADRFPTLRLILGKEEIAGMMNDDEKGFIGDVISVSGFCTHKREEFYVNPSYLIDAVQASPSEEVELHYSPNHKRKLLYINGGSGYEAWVTPRLPKKETE